MVTQSLLSGLSRNEAWWSKRQLSLIHCRRSEPTLKVRVCRLPASRMDTVTAPGQGIKRATTSKTSRSQSLVKDDFSAWSARCFTRTGIAPKRSLMVTLVPWAKVTSLCSGRHGVFLVKTLELWMLMELCE